MPGSVGSGARDAWARGQETRIDDLDDGIGTSERDGAGFRCLGAERCRKAGMREEGRARCLRACSERLLYLIAEGDLLREGVLEDPGGIEDERRRICELGGVGDGDELRREAELAERRAHAGSLPVPVEDDDGRAGIGPLRFSLFADTFRKRGIESAP